MKQIVLTLGAPNDEQGNLSPMAVDRLECTLGLYLHNNDVKILCTGGFGESFNTTNHPHAYYSKRFLIERGVKESDFLEFALTTNTVEDFRGTGHRVLSTGKHLGNTSGRRDTNH